MTIEAAPRAEERFPALDILRLICALAVVFFHFGFMQPVQAHALPARFAFYPDVTVYGHWGVQIFFVISGFVIAMSMRGRTASEFLWARFLRLYPTFWLCVSLTALATLAWPGDQPLRLGEYLVNMTMLAGYAGVRYLDIVYWTLSLELRFYVLIAAIMFFRLHRNLTLLAGIWLALCLANSVLPEFLSKLLMLKWMVFFIVGMLVYDLVDRRNIKVKAVLLLVATIWAAITVWNTATAGDEVVKTGQNAELSVFILVAGIGLVVAAAFLFKKAPWQSTARILGGLTYPLYLLHNKVGNAIVNLLPGADIGTRFAQLIALAVVVGLALAISLYIEPPLRGAFKRLRSTRRRREPVDALVAQ